MAVAPSRQTFEFMNTALLAEPEQLTEMPFENLRVRLPFGLLGFERVKEYELISHEDFAPFFWLQFLDDPELAFPVISPFVVDPTYQPEISPDDERFLGLECPSDALLLCVVTIRPTGGSTVNLKGPIVINRHSLVAKQVIPANAASFSLRHPLPIAD